MTQLLATLYLMYMSVFPVHAEPVTVSQQVYQSDAAIISTMLSTPTPTPVPSATPVPTQGPTPLPLEDNTPLDYIQELRKLGYILDQYDDPDLNVRNGVVRFQAAHNLVVDGDFGPKSLAALRKRIKDPDFKYTDSVQKPPANGKWILINKSTRCLTLYKGNAVIKKYPVAVGSPPSLTPDGKHKIVNRIVNPYWGGGGYAKPVEGGSPLNPLGYRWMGLDLGGGGAYGIHGNSSPYSIGTDASHGCVRMINADVEELFEIVTEGTPVWITPEEGCASFGIEQKEYGQE